MNHKLKKILKSWWIISLIIAITISIYSINPQFGTEEGVAIRNVAKDSAAEYANIESPKPNILPTKRERVLAIEYDYTKYPISNIQDYYDIVNDLEINRSIRIITNKRAYSLLTQAETQTVLTGKQIEVEIPKTIEVTKEVLNEETGQLENVTINETVMINVTEEVTKTIINPETNETEEVTTIITREIPKLITVLENETITTVIGTADLGLSVYNAPGSNLKKGLDLQGGTRVVLEPEEQLSSDEMDILKSNMETRLNIYGLSDLTVRVVRDKPTFLGGVPKFILVEIPGANEQEVKELLSKQGKFEAKIGNETVFKGGQDITYVCRSADCSGLDPSGACGIVSGNQWSCRFRFSITLLPSAAKRQADITRDLTVIGEGDNRYLSEKLILYLDDENVDELNIGEDLQGKPTTEISISGSGTGNSKQNAMFDALENMKNLQTIMITGSLPVKLNIVKTDNISPILGDKFLKNAMLVGLLAILAVASVVFIRYRNVKILIPMVVALLSEVLLLLGFASFVGWSLDIASIAGIIIVAGTGVDHLIIISDETLKGSEEKYSNWSDKLKKAFSIIMASYFTTLVAMLPLWFAGAGLLKGFAFTTIIGISLGVFITRPAYAKVIEVLLKD